MPSRPAPRQGPGSAGGWSTTTRRDLIRLSADEHPSKPLRATRGSDWRRRGNVVKRSRAAILLKKTEPPLWPAVPRPPEVPRRWLAGCRARSTAGSGCRAWCGGRHPRGRRISGRQTSTRERSRKSPDDRPPAAFRARPSSEAAAVSQTAHPSYKIAASTLLQQAGTSPTKSRACRSWVRSLAGGKPRSAPRRSIGSRG